MKRLLLVLLSSAMSAWSQTGLEAPKAPMGDGSSHDTTVLVQGIDGHPHEFQIPLTMSQAQKLVQYHSADLEDVYASQAGCPVQILQASFERSAQLMLTSHNRADSVPTLRLDYRNFSGKDIESVVLTGWLKVKDNPYQLDSVSRPFDLTLSRKALLGKDVEGTQVLELIANATGFDRIELARVTYVDGTTWSPVQRKCVYGNMGSTERAKAW